jgi:uncharacterized protein YfdQ (DUF2303 family)
MFNLRLIDFSYGRVTRFENGKIEYDSSTAKSFTFNLSLPDGFVIRKEPYNGLQKLKTFNFSSDSTMLVNGEKLIYAFLCFSHSFSYSRELHVKKMLK